MAQRRKPAARPVRPSRPRTPKSSGGGVRASGSVNVSPRFTLFGGGLLSFNFGGGGRKRGRGKGGLLKRAAGLVAKGLTELRGKGGKPSGGKPAGGKPAGKAPGSAAGGRSFAEFKASRPDLFEGPPEFDITVDSDVDDDDDNDDQADEDDGAGDAR